MRTVALTLALFGTGVFASTTAWAQSKQECITASESAQKLRDQHKLSKAREQFLVCARDACPGAIKQDCTEQAQKIADKMPSVVIHAKKMGSDIVDATVTIDSAIAARKLDGSPIQLDPGVHQFKIETPGESPVEQQVVIAEGEQNRVLDFTFGAPADTGAPPVTQVEKKKGFPILPVVVTGVAVVGFGMFATFGLLGTAEYNDAKKPTGCAPNCTNAQVDPIRTKLIVADISLGVGVAAAIGAVVLFIVHYSGGSSQEKPAAAQIGPGSFSYRF